MKTRYLFIIDISIIVCSIIISIFLAKTDLLVDILTATKGLEVFGSFVAGIFFTSAFTTAPATVTLGEIAQVNSILLVAFFGAVGAALGDLIIFRFVKDRFSKHLMELLKKKGGKERIKHLLRLRYFRWLTLLLGGLIIASPLPDELAVILLGFSKMRPSLFIPFSFISNFIGITMIGLVARALL